MCSYHKPDGFSMSKMLEGTVSSQENGLEVCQAKGKTEIGDKSEKSTQGKELTEKQILKNIVVISVAFFLLFTSFDGLCALQSTLHVQEGMGVITQSCLYSSRAISSLFVPKIAIQVIGYKWSVVVSIGTYILWSAANGFAVWATMLPASVLVGIFSALVWTIQGSYFTILGQKYAALKGKKTNAVLAKFFGVFFALFRLNGLVSAVIQTTILEQGRPENYTGPSDDEVALCGLRDCPAHNTTNINFDKPPPHILWTLVGVYIGLAVLSLLLAALFIDPLPASWLPDRAGGSVRQRTKRSLTGTVRHMRHREQLLLIPLTVYSGLEQTFYRAEYNKSYVTCLLGMWIISLVGLAPAVVNAVTSFTGGRLVKYTGILPLFVAAFSLDLGIQVCLMTWAPRPDDVVLIFVIPALHAVSNGIYQAQLLSYYGVLFPTSSEAAHSNYRLWESVGFITAFAWSSHLCTSVKLYMNTGFLIVGGSLFFLTFAKKRSDPEPTNYELTATEVPEVEKDKSCGTEQFGAKNETL